MTSAVTRGREISPATDTGENEEHTGELKSNAREDNARRNKEDSDDVKDIENFEDLLNIVGTCGRWNVMVFCLCHISSGIGAFQALTYEFLGATPDHWCRIDPLQVANWTQRQILDFAIPVRNDSSHERCLMFDYNYTLAAELGYETAMANGDFVAEGRQKTISCRSRDFNYTQHESTLVTEFDLVCERRALYSTTQAANQLGVFIGGLLAGYLNDVLGRRKVSLCFVVLSLVSGFGTICSTSIEVYIFLKTIVSVSVFCVYTSSFVTMLELCTTSQRSSVGSLFLIPWAVAYMSVPAFAYAVRPWRWLQSLYMLPSLTLLSYFWLMPESPRWLISKGRFNEAIEILRWAAKVNRRSLPPSEELLPHLKKMSTLVDKRENDSRQHILFRLWGTMKHLLVLILTPEFRQRAIISFVCWFSVSMIYYGISLNSSNLSADPYLYMFLGGVIEVPSYILLWPSMAHLGRRVSLISQYLVCCVTISAIAILMIASDNVPIWIFVCLSLTGKLAITATFHLLYIYTAELFPTQYRSLAIGESSMMARLGSIASPYVNDLLGDVVHWGPSALFAGVGIVASILALALPETKGCVLNEEKTFEKTITPKQPVRETNGYVQVKSDHS